MMMKYLILILLILFSMGFYLLIERKLMSIIQFRYGPNKIMFLGIFQFLIDMIKLLFKEQLYLFMFKSKFNFCLLMILLVSLMFWFIIMYNYINLFNYNYFIVLMLLMLIKMLILGLFLLMFKSMYIQISFIRMIIQFISYDILMMLNIIFFVLLINDFNILKFFFIQKYLMMFFLNFYLSFIWLISLLMEILRLPFDFYESESELISGFNLELGSINFMLVFMIEYLDLIYFINLTVLIMFFNQLMYLYLLLLLMLILWIRTLFIRYRYDKMMNLMWKILFYILIYLIIFYLIVLNI